MGKEERLFGLSGPTSAIDMGPTSAIDMVFATASPASVRFHALRRPTAPGRKRQFSGEGKQDTFCARVLSTPNGVS